MIYHVLVLVGALLLFGVLAFRQMNALLLATLVTIFVCVLSGMPVLDTLLGGFMPAAADYFMQYFMIFFVGALFGAVYRFTGAAEAIARAMSRLCGKKFAAPMIMCITGILTLGGVSGFVVFFVVYPIALQMFRQSDVSRRLIPAAISSGCWAWSMTAPGAPSIPNAVAMKSLGTTATAALIPSLIMTGLEFALIFIWLEWRARKLSAAGKKFYDESLKMQLAPEELEERPAEDLPHIIVALIPITAIFVCFNGLKLPMEISVTVGILLAVVLMFRKVKTGWMKVFNQGAADTGPAILNTGLVVGFSGVVKQTLGFSYLIGSLQNLDIAPLVFVAVTAAICGGVCGSASGGTGFAFASFTEIYKGLGVSFDAIHRTAIVAAGALATLPHQGVQLTLLGICKLTHKEAYFDIAVTQIVIPLLTLLVFIPLVSI
ncbi:MAG: GntP family permease [Anaerotignum sp.]|nr:GntP family permease [Anaerotignum sp.]